MKVYEFWLNEVCRAKPIEELATTFLRLHDDIYSLSRNPKTHWVQLLVRDTLPSAVETELRSRISSLSDKIPLRNYSSTKEMIAPMERKATLRELAEAAKIE